jgi:hypothetical protein
MDIADTDLQDTPMSSNLAFIWNASKCQQGVFSCLLVIHIQPSFQQALMQTQNVQGFVMGSVFQPGVYLSSSLPASFPSLPYPTHTTLSPGCLWCPLSGDSSPRHCWSSVSLVPAAHPSGTILWLHPKALLRPDPCLHHQCPYGTTLGPSPTTSARVSLLPLVSLSSPELSLIN